MAKRFGRLVMLLALIVLVVSSIAPAKAAGVSELKIIWAQWDPSNYLQTLVKDYEAKTGIKITVIQEPWGTYGNRVYAQNTSCFKANNASHRLPDNWTASNTRVKVAGRNANMILLYPLARAHRIFRAIKRPAPSFRGLFKRRKLHGAPVAWYYLG